MAELTLYGIKNCDTVKKARKHLEQQSRPYRFHDFRTDGIDQATIEQWLEQVELKLLLNTRSTTWRQLDEQDKTDLDNPKAVQLMLTHPTLIKRPVSVVNGAVSVGFKAADFDQWLSQHG